MSKLSQENESNQNYKFFISKLTDKSHVLELINDKKSDWKNPSRLENIGCIFIIAYLILRVWLH